MKMRNSIWNKLPKRKDVEDEKISLALRILYLAFIVAVIVTASWLILYSLGGPDATIR